MHPECMMRWAAWGLCLSLVSAAVSKDFHLFGHGDCRDSKGQAYENWWGYVPELTYKHHNKSTCGCHECEQICKKYKKECVGFEFFCCPDGERCIAGAMVLFNKNMRPKVAPPTNFSTRGWMNSSTSGSDFNGTGPVTLLSPSDWSCYIPLSTSSAEVLV
eukprot:gnl/MRDRNA2_/MRDRNA2_131659_c0_seq1.p1 gnl/MRDRNA2_/MRDRNA2_131659_c0~~gnl/MRDRNA2_/MRDRNA2_131659_c0_seq1.p1  ORF type:complete len:160 (-),score=16.69 gnl/MRDRNA2_/MRDRNA2_131659_c0_seq1:77-556(-)